MRFFAYKIELHMRNGSVLKGHVTSFKQKTRGDDLTSLSWEGGTMPFYFRLSDVVAVTTKKIINWRRLFR